MEYLILKYLHIIAFVYWLGGDLGTFIASKHVIRRDISPEARHIALKIMLACDQGPKVAMPLILPLGFHLSVLMGLIDAPTWLLVVVWVICLDWCANVLALYFNESKPFTESLARIDFKFRIGVIALLTLFAGHSLITDGLISADWVAWKILIFAAMVTSGLFIRVNLKPFIPAFGEMMQNGATEKTDNTMHNSVIKCRPFVWFIWAGLFLNTAIGTHIIG